jgi:hypothetical protein
MATQTRTPQQEALDRAVESSRKATEEARRRYGDNWQEEADNIIRDIYDEETLHQMLKYLIDGRSDWDDEEDELADAE